jgi:hypothetical protein
MHLIRLSVEGNKKNLNLLITSNKKVQPFRYSSLIIKLTVYPVTQVKLKFTRIIHNYAKNLFSPFLPSSRAPRPSGATPPAPPASCPLLPGCPPWSGRARGPSNRTLAYGSW